MDKTTKEPLGASVEFMSKTPQIVETDPATGEYKFWIASGRYYIKVKSPGCKDKTKGENRKRTRGDRAL